VQPPSERRTESLGFIEVDPVGGKLVTLAKLCGWKPVRKRADGSLPQSLGDFMFRGPEAFGEGHFRLGFVRPASALGCRAAHEEPTRRTPAERHPINDFLFAGLDASKWRLRCRTGPGKMRDSC
jgi:hypothetical protein